MQNLKELTVSQAILAVGDYLITDITLDSTEAEIKSFIEDWECSANEAGETIIKALDRLIEDHLEYLLKEKK